MEDSEAGSPTMNVKEELQEDPFGSDPLEVDQESSVDFDKLFAEADETNETGAGSTNVTSKESKTGVRDAHNHAKRPSRSSRAADLFAVEDVAESPQSELSTDKEEA